MNKSNAYRESVLMGNTSLDKHTRAITPITAKEFKKSFLASLVVFCAGIALVNASSVFLVSVGAGLMLYSQVWYLTSACRRSVDTGSPWWFGLLTIVPILGWVCVLWLLNAGSRAYSFETRQ